MTEKIVYEVGEKFHYWTISGQRIGRQVMCRCVCGKESLVAGYALRNGHSKSCGCRAYESIKARFEAKYVKSESGCWTWTSTTAKEKNGNRRAQIRVSGKYVYAARVSYELHIGAVPLGELVLHKCDNPLCVNPNHLFPGTYQDNVLDAIGKGRFKHLENIAIYNDQRKNHA